MKAYRKRKLSNGGIVTNDCGNHLFLDDFNKLTTPDKKLRERLINAGMILNNDNVPGIIAKMKKKYSFLSQGPSLHIIITTLRCDLKCKYCHASSVPQTETKYDMDEQTAKKTVDMIFQSPSDKIMIEFQGGEPLLNFKIIKTITKYAKEVNKKAKKDLLLSIVTNLTQMDNEKLKYLMDNNIGICTSLDGPKKLHNKNRQGYDQVIKWMNIIKKEYKLRKITNTRLNALVTITKDSLDYSKEIIDEYRKQGLNTIHLRSLNNLGNAKMIPQMSYSAEDFIKFWTESMDYILKINKKEFFLERKTLIILKKILGEYDPGFTDLRSPCGAVIGQMVYNYDGSVFTCDEGRMVEDLFKIGTIDEKYSDITTNETACSILAASVNDTQYCSKCAYKPYCGLCPVLNYAVSGSIISNITASDWCKVHMAQFDYIFEKLHENSRKTLLTWYKKGDLISTLE